MTLDLSHESVSKTHDKILIPQPGFWFKDLKGNPLWMKPTVLIHWTPKIK